jgi:hypothetical protein
MLRAALMRRHLNDDQRAVLAAKWAKREAQKSRSDRARKAGEQSGRGRGKAVADSSASPRAAKLLDESEAKRKPRRVEAASKQFGVSEKRVRKGLELEKSNPDLAEQVLQGELSLSGAKRHQRVTVSSPPASSKGPASAAHPPAAAAKLACSKEESTAATRESAWPLMVPAEPPAALANALVDRLGQARALQILREALAVVKAANIVTGS